MSQKQVRKRGANYTQEEKSMLLDLIMQFKHIIENKRTGSMILQKKKEAWHAITFKYNSNCSSGPRDTEQLKALYDNMKQKSRKEVGETNKVAYIEAGQSKILTEVNINQAIQINKEDKIQMHKTGGGFWKPKMTENEAKVLSIIQDQVEPLSNPYDSASVFFKEAVTNNEMQINDEIILPSILTPTEMPENVVSSLAGQSGDVTPKAVRRNVPVKKIVYKQKKIKKSMSADAYKVLYFKKKCQNADLERKKIMMEIMNIRKEHNLKIELLKSQLAETSKNNEK